MTETKMENGNETSCTKAEVVVPHDHDVLSGRGNFVNYHAGNEHFRALVRKHKVAYLACPKPQKGQFSRMIVDEIRLLDPPGRFLKQDKVTQLWYDIGDKKALDKTRQALREGAPDLMKNLVNSDEDDDEDEPTQNDLYLVRGNAYRFQTSGIVRLVNPFSWLMYFTTVRLVFIVQVEIFYVLARNLWFSGCAAMTWQHCFAFPFLTKCAPLSKINANRRYCLQLM